MRRETKGKKEDKIHNFERVENEKPKLIFFTH